MVVVVELVNVSGAFEDLLSMGFGLSFVVVVELPLVSGAFEVLLSTGFGLSFMVVVLDSSLVDFELVDSFEVVGFGDS